MLHDEETFWRLVEDDPAAIPFVTGPAEKAALAQTRVHVSFGGPEDRPRLLSLPPREWLPSILGRDLRWITADRRSRLRSTQLDVGSATPSTAERLGIELDSWQGELVRASLVDPIDLSSLGQKVARVLKRGGVLRIEHPNGTDLNLRIRPRSTFVEDGVIDSPDRLSGRIVRSIPSGSVTVALEELEAEGEIESNRRQFDPILRPGYSEGNWLSFRNGRLADYSFDRGGEGFEEDYRLAGAGRDRPAFVTFGLNPKVERAPFRGELERGVIGVAIGGNRQVGGRTSLPFSHQALLGGADVSVDGRPLLRDGGFVRVH